MKKAIAILFFVTLIGCSGSDDFNNCFPEVSVNLTVNLNLAQYIDLQIPGGWAYASGGLQGIVIVRTGNSFKAFDRLCPTQLNRTCSPMNYNGTTKLICSCDQSEYSVLDGHPVNGEENCFAQEYRVDVVSSSMLRVTNF